MNDLRMLGKYKVDTDRTRVKKLAALAFIPVADVVPSFESVAIRFLHDKLPFLSYFEKNWIGAPVAGNRRLALNYSLHMWNVLDRSSTVITGSIQNVVLEACRHSLYELLYAYPVYTLRSGSCWTVSRTSKL